MLDFEVVEKKENSMLSTFDSMLKFADTVAKSGLVPAGLDTKEKVFTAIQWGKELGLPPMVAINSIAVINGKPSLSTDVMHGLAKRSPLYHGIKWIEQSEKRAECVIELLYSDGTKDHVKGVYTIEDAERAGLTKKDNWKNYPVRMLQKRALSFALRDAFPEILSGLISTDEAADITSGENIRNITPEAETTTTATAEAAMEDFN